MFLLSLSLSAWMETMNMLQPPLDQVGANLNEAKLTLGARSSIVSPVSATVEKLTNARKTNGVHGGGSPKQEDLDRL